MCQCSCLWPCLCLCLLKKRILKGIKKKKQRAGVVYEQIVDNEGELSNCFSINQLVGQNIISKNQTETSVKRTFSAIISNLKVDSFRY